jgi:hypothetical protein
MKYFTRIASSVAVAVVAGAMLAGTVMAAPPSPQTTTTPVVPGTGLHIGGGNGMRNAPAWSGFEEEVAAFLGMSQEQVQAERLAGKSLVQIAQAKGKTEAQLVSTILTAKRADLDKAVADKSITQAQADLIYQNMQTQVPQMVNRTTTGPASGQGMRMGTGAGNQSGARMGGRGMGR